MNSLIENLSKNPVLILLGAIASCISIFVFVTGINNLNEVVEPAQGTLAVITTERSVPASSLLTPSPVSIKITESVWADPLSARKPSLNEIRADNPVSIWVRNAIAVRDMTDPGTDYYTGTAEFGREYLLPVYWCANSPETLQQNMDNIETTFLVNDQVVPEKYIFNYNYDTDNGWNCSYHAVILGNWNIKTQYNLQVQRIIKADVSDGVLDYPAGKYTISFSVNVK